MTVLAIESEAHWHALRARHIGGSEIGALFDRHPYITRFMLWHAKKPADAVPIDAGSARADWGKLLEPAIAEGVSREMRWSLVKRAEYHRHAAVEGMGCTVDYFVVDHESGPGIIECKNVDAWIWREVWTESRAPLHIELQVQHQLACTGMAWAAIAALVGGNTLRIYERKPDPAAIAEIERRVAAFWASIASGQAPDPLGVAAEAPQIAGLSAPPEPEHVADLTGDEAAFEAARMLHWARARESEGRKIAEASRLRLLARIGRAGRVTLPGFDIRRSKSGAIHKLEPTGEIPVFPNAEFDFV